MERDAQLSEDGRYRYQLTRRWSEGPVACFIGLNPSTADARVDDPTIRRCIGFARSWGCGALEMLNLFALRATDPRVMRADSAPVGPDNEQWLRSACERSEIIVACWGVHGVHLGRAGEVRGLLGDDLLCLGTTKDGHPRHPLYLPASAQLRPF